MALGMVNFARAEPPPGPYGQQAREVTEYLQKHFYNQRTGLYAITIDNKTPDHLWGCGVMFSALVAAARHEPHYRAIMRKYFDGIDSYWDQQTKPQGYEPSPTAGHGHDKYYDDNAWMVLTFLEARELTGEARYLKRAEETLDFVMSGWDNAAGGGIWWHEKHKDDAKNTCVNGPAAVGCFRISKFSPNPKTVLQRIADGRKIVAWTTKTLRDPNGLFSDHITVTTGAVDHGQLTYNAGLMLRAYLTLYACTGEANYLEEAKRVGKAAESLLDKATGAYRDAQKWSHLMVEADLELYRWTSEAYLLKRAQADCDFHYADWKQHPPADLLTNASMARELWLLADRETPAGQAFWKQSDQLKK